MFRVYSQLHSGQKFRTMSLTILTILMSPVIQCIYLFPSINSRNCGNPTLIIISLVVSISGPMFHSWSLTLRTPQGGPPASRPPPPAPPPQPRLLGFQVTLKSPGHLMIWLVFYGKMVKHDDEALDLGWQLHFQGIGHFFGIQWWRNWDSPTESSACADCGWWVHPRSELFKSGQSKLAFLGDYLEFTIVGACGWKIWKKTSRNPGVFFAAECRVRDVSSTSGHLDGWSHPGLLQNLGWNWFGGCGHRVQWSFEEKPQQNQGLWWIVSYIIYGWWDLHINMLKGIQYEVWPM